MNPFILINHLFYVKILIKKIGTNQNQLTENVFFFANRVSFAAEKKKTHRLQTGEVFELKKNQYKLFRRIQ